MWLASASTKPRSDFCTTMMVVPIGGSEAPILLLGCGPTVGPVGWGEVVCVGPVVAVGLAVAQAAADVPRAPVDGAAVATVVEDPRPEFDVEDPPHAASSSASDPRPAAAAHPLLRITLSFIDGSFPALIRRERQGLLPSPAGDVAGGQLDHVPHATDAVP